MSSASTPPGGRPGDVELSIPAVAERLTTITAVAADLGLRADMTLEDIADLRLAVTEACAVLVADAHDGARVHCSFWVNDDQVEILGRVRGGGAITDGDGFRRRVLNTLADLVEWSVEPVPGRGEPAEVRIRLRKDV